ncbi:MAG: HEPN domain-containing protein [Bacteroidales bacterium]
MDIKKQIEYWINTADDGLNTAELLIANKKYLHGLFFCHLCIEKGLKAHIVRCTNQIPPKLHSLSRLLTKTDLKLSDDDMKLTDTLMIYQLEGRYPEYYPIAPSPDISDKILIETKSLFLCLKNKL